MAYVPFAQLDDAALAEIVNGAGSSGSQRNAARLELATRAFKAKFELNCDHGIAELDVQNQGQATTADMLWKALVAAKKAGCLELVVRCTKGPAKGKKARYEARADLIRKVGEGVARRSKGKVTVDSIVPDAKSPDLISVFLKG